MITTYELKLSDGTTSSATTLDEVRQVAREHPDVEINPIVHYRACSQHASFEAENCPRCPS